MLCDDLERWDGQAGRFKKREMYVYIYLTADSLRCTAKTDIVNQLYSNKKYKE